MTGREIREHLAAAGVLPSKQLGQNFLIDPNMARWIVSRLELKAEDTVVEVGPGTGALSEHLVGAVRRLILIEFDARLAAALEEKFREADHVEVHHADGAKFDRRRLFRHRPVKFLGNLPYSSGGAILKNLLTSPHPFCRAVIMLQKEVVERLAAQTRSADYGMLALRTQVDWQVTPLRVVPPEAFYPRPQIDSMVAVLTPRPGDLPAFDRRLFDQLVRRGFAQRRKQLGKQLPSEPPWPELAATLGIPSTARGEELALETWVELARAYDLHPLKEVAQRDDELFDVVDERDQVIGSATRREVHAQALLHRAVHVFVFNRRGELLLQQRSRFKDSHPGAWDSSVAGHLDQGECYEAAAHRELKEEMGIENAVLTELARLPVCEETGWEHARLYRTDYHGVVQFPAAEIDHAWWFPVAEIQAWVKTSPADFASSFLACWRAWQAATEASGELPDFQID